MRVHGCSISGTEDVFCKWLEKVVAVVNNSLAIATYFEINAVNEYLP